MRFELVYLFQDTVENKSFTVPLEIIDTANRLLNCFDTSSKINRIAICKYLCNSYTYLTVSKARIILYTLLGDE